MGYKEQFEFWLEDSYFDEGTKQELLAIRNDEKEIEDRFYKELAFGTGGLPPLFYLKVPRSHLLCAPFISLCKKQS